MLAFIIRIIAFIAALWIVRRLVHLLFGNRPRGSTADPAKKSPAPPQSMVKDPVCGMYMDPRLAFRLNRREGDLFFCSEGCRDKYESRPD